MRNFVFHTIFSFSIISAPLAAQTLEKNKDYKEGISALKDNLTELAVTKFTAALNAPDLKAKEKQSLLLLLAEAQIRAKKPELAINILNRDELAKLPDATFWLGLAYAEQQRYRQAIDTLLFSLSTTSYKTETKLSLANLFLAIGDEENAQKYFQEIANSKATRSRLNTKAQLTLASLFIKNKQLDEAKKVLSSIKKSDGKNSPSATQLKTKVFLEASLLFQEKKYAETIQILSDYLAVRENISAQSFHQATLMLADAHHLNGDTAEALNDLIQFIDEFPSSPHLDNVFMRFTEWLPADTKINDPKIQKLAEWANRSQSSVRAISQTNENLQSLAHFYYASYLAQSDDPNYLSKALFELSLLRFRHATHALAGMSLIETARVQLKLDQKEEAKDSLGLLRKIDFPISPIAKQQAAYIEGMLRAESAEYQTAAKSFRIARDANNRSLAAASTINLGIAYLAGSNTVEFAALADKTKDAEILKTLQLEHALWLSKQNPNQAIEARPLLQQFIKNYPDAPRINEALMALATHSIRVSPVDPEVCKKALDQLADSKFGEEQYAEYENIRYLFFVSQANYVGAIDAANSFLKAFPNSARNIQFTLLKGQALYRDGQHNEARKILLALAAANEASKFAAFATYYAALAARLEGTPQSQQEAILLFEKVIAKKSPIKLEAILQLSNLYNSINQPEKGAALLEKIYQPKSTTLIQRDVAIQLSESYQAMGASDPAFYQKTIDVYDHLLKQKDLPVIWFNRVNYNKADALQSIGKDQQALETYYAVINIDHKKNPITEWTWYYKCGFNAISMLERLGNPKGAIQIAKKLASTEGPDMIKAVNKARNLEMKYMIW